MRYSEPREKSAELLRLVIGLMQQHPAAMNPVAYAVWYEHVAGINARLSQALERQLQVEPRLGDASILRLYQEHVAEVDVRAVERVSGDFQRVMAGMAETASSTSARAGDFGAQLSQLSEVLAGQHEAPLQEHLQDILVKTGAMQQSASELQGQIDISQKEIERLRADLDRTREEALRDGLTGVLNRRAFDLEIDRLCARVAPGGGTHGLVMLDIDNFKVINDSRGHLVGDRVLAAVGEVLRHITHDTGQLAARYGGEEFALLLPEATLEQAVAVAERVRGLIKAMKLRHRGTQEVVLTVTVSAGVTLRHAGESAEDWIARADAALYQSKQAGRDRVTGLA